MAAQILIEEAAESDFEQVVDVFAGENLFHAELLPRILRVAEPSVTKEWYTEVLGNPKKVIFVAKDAGKVVGLLLIREENSPKEPIFRPRRYAYLEVIAVAEGYRGQGIGHLLMNEVYAWVLAQGMNQIELQVWEVNEGARRFYEKLAFETTRRTMRLVLTG